MQLLLASGWKIPTWLIEACGSIALRSNKYGIISVLNDYQSDRNKQSARWLPHEFTVRALEIESFKSAFVILCLVIDWFESFCITAKLIAI